MALTPMDIYNKEFSKGFRGYDEEEVDMFLDQVVDEYEKLQKANAAANEKIESLTERLQHYRSLEDTLKETLMTAQNTAEEVVENARKKAALIIDSAQREARDIVERANARIEEAQGMDIALRKAAAVFKSRFVALLEAQLEFFRQETKDINAAHYTVQPEQAPPQEEPEQTPADAYIPEPPAESASEAPEPIETVSVQEPVEFMDQEPAESMDQEPAEPIALEPEEAAPMDRPFEPEPADNAAVHAAEQDDIDYFGAPQSPAEPLDAAEEDIADDADALIREIQHYSALRSDEDTVSDEGFIIGSDD